MRLFLVLLFCILSLQSIRSQETKDEREKRLSDERVAKLLRKDSIQDLPIHTYFSLDLINSIVPKSLGRLNIGYITPISEKWSVGGSAGIGFDAISYAGDNEDYFLWEVSPEILYNFGEGKRFRHYLSLELFYINHTETLEDDDFSPVNTLNGTVERIAFESARYERQKYGFVFNFGEHIDFTNRIAFRTSLGAGLRIKDNSFSNLVNAVVTDSERSFFSFGDGLFEGSRLGFELNIDFRLIYKLKI